MPRRRASREKGPRQLVFKRSDCRLVLLLPLVFPPWRCLSRHAGVCVCPSSCSESLRASAHGRLPPRPSFLPRRGGPWRVFSSPFCPWRALSSEHRVVVSDPPTTQPPLPCWCGLSQEEARLTDIADSSKTRKSLNPCRSEEQADRILSWRRGGLPIARSFDGTREHASKQDPSKLGHGVPTGCRKRDIFSGTRL